MDKQKAMIIAIFFLGIAIIIGSMQIAQSLDRVSYNPEVNVNTSNISNALREIAHQIDQQETVQAQTEAMYFSAAAEYLGLTYKELKVLIEEKNLDIPYIKIDQKYVFYKSSLNEWLKQIQQQEYIMD